MKIYFHASINQKNEFGLYYDRIVRHLERLGYKVDATHNGGKEINFASQVDATGVEISEYYSGVIKQIQQADTCVFEISYPSSVSVGHYLTRALQLGKSVLALYKKGTRVNPLFGWDHERIYVMEYTDRNLMECIKYGMEQLASVCDQRFTLLLPSEIITHLDELSERGVNRSEYIRTLIRKDMER